jgi:hypothetical protein
VLAGARFKENAGFSGLREGPLCGVSSHSWGRKLLTANDSFVLLSDIPGIGLFLVEPSKKELIDDKVDSYACELTHEVNIH